MQGSMRLNSCLRLLCSPTAVSILTTIVFACRTRITAWEPEYSTYPNVNLARRSCHLRLICSRSEEWLFGVKIYKWRGVAISFWTQTYINSIQNALFSTFRLDHLHGPTDGWTQLKRIGGNALLGWLKFFFPQFDSVYVQTASKTFSCPGL